MTDLLQLRIGFELGLYSRDDVEAWVDAQVLASDRPADALLSLTTMARRPIDDVAKLLAELDVPRDHRELIHTQLAVFGELYRLERISLGSAILQIYRSAHGEEVLTDEQEASLNQLEDALSLAQEGVYATMEEVQRDFAAFIAAFPLSKGVCQSR